MTAIGTSSGLRCRGRAVHPPALDGFTPRRIERFSSASRSLSALSGTFASCDAVSGDGTGPNNGEAQLDARSGARVRADASGDVARSAAVLDFLDAAPTPNLIEAQTFSMTRVADTITCEQVRALSF